MPGKLAMVESGFYAAAVRVLKQAGIPFRVGGAYAFHHYTGIFRDTKDFDLFVRPRDLEQTLSTFQAAGYEAELTYTHWLGKVHQGEAFIDLIFRAGNGLGEVDDLWFRENTEADLLGERVGLVPIEEMIWQKAFIMERERFDGADIAHLLRAAAERLDWAHLRARFGRDGRILLAHLVLFGYIYPGERHRLPAEVLRELLAAVEAELTSGAPEAKIYQGPFLSRAQYLPEIERWGYQDARAGGRCAMSPEEMARWTDAAPYHPVVD